MCTRPPVPTVPWKGTWVVPHPPTPRGRVTTPTGGSVTGHVRRHASEAAILTYEFMFMTDDYGVCSSLETAVTPGDHRGCAARCRRPTVCSRRRQRRRWWELVAESQPVFIPEPYGRSIATVASCCDPACQPGAYEIRHRGRCRTVAARRTSGGGVMLGGTTPAVRVADASRIISVVVNNPAVGSREVVASASCRPTQVEIAAGLIDRHVCMFDGRSRLSGHCAQLLARRNWP